MSHPEFIHHHLFEDAQAILVAPLIFAFATLLASGCRSSARRP